MNTQIIKTVISNSNFERIITEIDNFVFVNLDHFTNRVYQSQGVNEFLYSIGGYKNHILVFLIRDGVNCRITGIREIISKVIADLNLTKETCYIYGYDNLELENTTFIDMDVLLMWAAMSYKKIKDLPQSTNQFQKKFAALYGRHDIYRLKIFRHLYNNYKDESVLAFNSIIGQYNTKFSKEFQDDIDWYHTNCPVLLDFEQANNWVSYEESLNTIGLHYNQYFLEIVAETDFYTDKFFTEKTLKNFYLGKPFLLWSGPHSLFRLREAGFQTFGPYINESYDSIQNTRERFEAILNEIDRLAQLSLEQLQEIHEKLNERLQFNRDYFTQFVLTR